MRGVLAISRTRNTRKRALAVQERRERRARRIEEIPEHVHVAAVIDRGDLDAGNDANALPPPQPPSPPAAPRPCRDR